MVNSIWAATDSSGQAILKISFGHYCRNFTYKKKGCKQWATSQIVKKLVICMYLKKPYKVQYIGIPLPTGYIYICSCFYKSVIRSVNVVFIWGWGGEHYSWAVFSAHNTETHVSFITFSSFLSSKNSLILSKNILAKAFCTLFNFRFPRIYFAYEFSGV